MPFVLFIDPETREHVIVELSQGEIALGRGSENDICIRGHLIGRRHAVLRQESGGGYRLIDLNSRNGVWILRAGIPVEGHVLKDREVFSLADIVVTYFASVTPPVALGTARIIVTLEGIAVRLEFPGYHHVSGLETFREDWAMRVLPFFKTIAGVEVIVDVMLFPKHIAWDFLLNHLRTAGEILAERGCQWRIAVTCEMIAEIAAALKLDPQRYRDIMQSSCHVLFDFELPVASSAAVTEKGGQ